MSLELGNARNVRSPALENFLEALKLPEVILLFPIPWKWKTVAGKLQEHREVFLKIPGFAPSSVQLFIGIFLVAFPAFWLRS